MPDDFKFRALTIEDWKNDAGGLTFKDGLTLKPGQKNGIYISNPLDSGVAGCRWHRIVLEADIPENSRIAVSFFTSESKEEPKYWSGKRVFIAAKDALVEAAKGRYITLKIELHSEGDKVPVLELVKIYYPRLSYLRYLPAIYQENKESSEFLERFLSIFESALYDSEETISRIPMYFDPMAAPEEFYRWLAGWLSLDLYDLLDEDKKREFILRAVEFYEQKGTVAGIASLVSFLTEKKCCIKEYMDNVFRSYGMEHREEHELRVDEAGCKRFYRKTSTTINTKDPYLISNTGTYDDELHYVIDARKNGRYSPHVIGIFIFISSREKEFIIEQKQLLKIINSFLPVFVRAEIIIVEEFDEIYYISDIIDEYYDDIHATADEQFKEVAGIYRDEADWNWLYAYGGGHNGHTNDLGFRTQHSKLGVWRQL